jgi:hypothetical protein
MVLCCTSLFLSPVRQQTAHTPWPYKPPPLGRNPLPLLFRSPLIHKTLLADFLGFVFPDKPVEISPVPFFPLALRTQTAEPVKRFTSAFFAQHVLIRYHLYPKNNPAKKPKYC